MAEAAQKTETTKTRRPPVVAVLGHIDHGKTSLLDKIRQANVAGKESGGITQHIGAYEIEAKSKEGSATGKITFIDTPGHEAFSKMRSRGVGAADIALLVVAADDGVKLQTEESLKIIQEAGTPFIVVLNKIDKENADPERVKKELGDRGIFIEEWGGKVPLTPVSAKTGQGIEHLLELILLLADLENLEYDPALPARGVVIESHLEPKRGNAATLLVREGVLRQGDWVLAGRSRVKARIVENFLGKTAAEIGASSPARIVGFDSVPAVGSLFTSFKGQKELEAAFEGMASSKEKQEEVKAEEGKRAIPVVIKADTAGSLEAVEHELKKIEDGTFTLNILRSSVGNISEDDIKLAASGESSLAAGFRVKMAREAGELAERFGVGVGVFDIIYELVDWLKRELEKRLPEEKIIKILGEARVLKIFKQEGARQIVGGKVESGMISEGKRFRLLRRQFPIGEGRIIELQMGKMRTKEVGEKAEFGVLADSEHEIVPGDELEVFDEEIKKKKLL